MIVKTVHEETRNTTLYEADVVRIEECVTEPIEAEGGKPVEALGIYLGGGDEHEAHLLFRPVALPGEPWDYTYSVYVMNDRGKTVEVRRW